MTTLAAADPDGELADLIAIAYGACRDGPGSVTHRVYWVRDGDWLEIPYEIDDGSLNVHAPEELIETLNTAAAEEPGE